MNHSIEELFPFYALGTLTQRERAEVEAYVAGNPEAQTRLQEMVETAALLPYHVAPVAPSAQTKRKLMARVQAETTPKLPSRPATSWWHSLRAIWEQLRLHPVTVPAFALVALVCLTAVSLWAFSLNRQLTQQQTQVAALQTQLDSLQDELTQIAGDKEQLQIEITDLQNVNEALQQQLTEQETALALFRDPTTQIYPIAGKEPQPRALGKLVIHAESQTAVFVASRLEILPGDKVYQLWFIQGDQPVGMGTFQVNDQGEGQLVLSNNAGVVGITAVGVSIEPLGGSPQPTGDIILLSVISS